MSKIKISSRCEFSYAIDNSVAAIKKTLGFSSFITDEQKEKLLLTLEILDDLSEDNHEQIGKLSEYFK